MLAGAGTGGSIPRCATSLPMTNLWEFETRRLAYDYEQYLLNTLDLQFLTEKVLKYSGNTECFYNYKAPIYPLTSNQEKG